MLKVRPLYLLILLSLLVPAVHAQEPEATDDHAHDHEHPEVDLQHLPLGDGKVSSEPQRGYIWSCRTQFNGGGAFADGPWIDTVAGTWDATAKLIVDGAVLWPNYTFTIEAVGEERIITGNGLPDHPTGVFPIQPTDDAYEYDRNPNSISEQTVRIVLPVHPTLADAPSCIGGMVGFSAAAIPIFNGFDAEGRDAVAHEIQDSCNGHPQVDGVYHYHNIGACLEELEAGEGHSPILGFAFDGFGIYGFRGEDGQVLSNDDLDECHGHSHEIEWEGQTVEMYHYHATAEFPYTVGCYRGTPVMSGPPGGQGGGPGQAQGQGPGGGPPPGGQGPNGQQPPPPPGGGQNGQQPPPPPGG